MPSLSKFLADNRALTEKEADWLQHLVGDWNLLSDLLRSDLVRTKRTSVALLAVVVVQIAFGVYQARNGLPELAVGVHMVLAALTAATMTIVVLRLKRPALVS